MSTIRLFEQLTEEQARHKEKLVEVLSKYMPANATSLCAEMIMFYRLHLHIEVERKGRYGDYTPHTGKHSRISVNHNLSPYEFLITFVHELAHHTAFQKCGPNHDAHGMEWKNEFRNCMRPFLEMDVFPYDLKAILSKHMQNPKYSQSADVKLLQALRRYDPKRQHAVTVQQLPDGALFKLKKENLVLRKIKKLRTYVLCETPDGNWQYRVHAMAEADPVS